MNIYDGIYTVERIYNNTYRIDEKGAANCYLVLGEEKALLIDSCWGLGDLRGCVKQLTDKPVIVAMTHRHPDHTFGAHQFGDFYCHENDNTSFHKFLENPMIGALSVKRLGGKKQKRKKVKILPLHDKETFDLGNRKIEVKLSPGHTAGSVIFADHENKLLFTGDNVNPHLWVHSPSAVSLEEWTESARVILQYMEEGYSVHIGHGDGKRTKQQVETILGYATEILELDKQGKLTRKHRIYPQKGGEYEIKINLKKITRE